MKRSAMRDRNAILYVLSDGERWHGYSLHQASGVRAGRTYVILADLMRLGLVWDGWDEGEYPQRRWYQVVDR